MRFSTPFFSPGSLPVVSRMLSLERPERDQTLEAAAQPVEYITEGQFAAVVRDFNVSRKGETLYYHSEADPWEYERCGVRITARHRLYPLPARYYEIFD